MFKAEAIFNLTNSSLTWLFGVSNVCINGNTHWPKLAVAIAVALSTASYLNDHVCAILALIVSYLDKTTLLIVALGELVVAIAYTITAY